MLWPQRKQSETADASDGRSHRAFNLSLLLGIMAAIMAVSSYLVRPQSNTPILSAIIITIVSVVSFIAASLSRQGKSTLGILLLIVAVNVAFPIFIVQTAGLGLLVGLMIIVISSGFALQTLPPKLARQVTLVGLLVGITTILADAFWPIERLAVPDALRYASIGMATALFFFVILVGARNFANYSLNVKLISATVVVAVVAVVSITLLISRFTRNTLTTEVGSNLANLANAHALNVGEFLARELNSLEALAVNQFLQEGVVAHNAEYSGDEADILAQMEQRDEQWLTAADNDPLVTAVLEHPLTPELWEFKNIFPENVEIFITDRYGGLIASTNRTSDYYQADEEWWQEAYGEGFGGTHIGNPAFDESSNTLAINLAIPLFDRNASGQNRIAGILRTTINLGALSDILLAAGFDETGAADLYFPNNTQISLAESGRVIVESLTTEQATLLTQLQNNSERFINDSYNGIPSFISQNPVNTLTHEPFVDNLNWTVVVHQAEFEALAPVEQQQRFQLLLGIVVVLAAAGVAALVGQLLTGPITRLTNVALQVAGGDLQARAQVETQDEVGTLATAFNSMTDQLQDLVGTLEQRVAVRTHAILTSAEVGRRLSTILDQAQLVRAVVEQVSAAFDYYHTHIYLYDENRQRLVMMSGTGQAGQEMLAQGHTILAGQGLVGKAATTNNVVLVPDVTQAEGWLPNPLLPETESEVAVPIALGDRVLGVLDVQNNVKNSLQQEDADLLLSIANQIAIALQNARQYAEAQARAEQVAYMNTITQKIQATTSVENALQVAVREIGRATKAKQTVVKLNTPHTTNGNE